MFHTALLWIIIVPIINVLTINLKIMDPNMDEALSDLPAGCKASSRSSG